MENVVAKVLPNSIAEEVGIEAGDKLISINEQEVKDILDYKFLISDEVIILEIEKNNEEIWEIEIEKEYDEDLGVEFKKSIMDEAKSCHNKCIFCFIDQLPKGMRESLYFKDDDSRLSFLQGNFVTLTNLKDEDLERIIKYKISPINVSVHTTNPELRKKMLNNRFAGNVYERLKKLTHGGITINCQIVLCPEINDGEELIKTVEDLYKLYPLVKNIAVVPVGITKYREGLCNLKLFNKESALKQLYNISKLQNKYISEIGTPFVRLSDEFYLIAGKDIPGSEFYEEFDQIEDGVGMIRMFRDNIDRKLNNINNNKKGSFSIITGKSAFKEVSSACNKVKSVNPNININVFKILNKFFGEDITVAGLITGEDIKNQVDKNMLGDYIIISKNMLRTGENIFLDDITIQQLEEYFNKKILTCEYSGEDLIEIINSYSEEEK
ncbi:DUF512 domain-containing protein [Clostridium rectalis]|uniref:DUF512 domain-containing protein n=1 Tax=Clostridium rectalis TaxID=2040295 RepID=UPI000F62DB82|nr:DUF512 domain-containing protein [Clostridium rectalis]